MPKDEIDPEDPLELCGVALLTAEDTSVPMTECFIEEFMRLGHSPRRILALFRNPHYTGPNMVLQNRGEEFVKSRIIEVFGWWGRKVERAAPDAPPDPVAPADNDTCAAPVMASEIHRAPSESPVESVPSAQVIEMDPAATEPGGAAIPKLQY